MSEKKLTQEQVETLQKCKSKEKVEKFAQEDQLTDEELEKMVGGDHPPAPGGGGDATLHNDPTSVPPWLFV